MKKILALVLALCLVFALCACGSKDAKETTIVVGATASPHAEILETVKDALAAEGYTLEIVVYDDYVLPNTALEEGELDANYFQHVPYLESFNESQGTDLVSAAAIHYEPMGLFCNGTYDENAEGVTCLIPADDSNMTRALLLLRDAGLVTLEEGKNLSTGVSNLDVTSSKVTLVPTQADVIPAQLLNGDQGTLAVVNGNYALDAGLDFSEVICIESATGEAAQTYANVIAVRAGDENSAKTQALVKVLTTPEVKAFIEETYAGQVQAMF